MEGDCVIIPFKDLTHAVIVRLLGDTGSCAELWQRCLKEEDHQIQSKAGSRGNAA